MSQKMESNSKPYKDIRESLYGQIKLEVKLEVNDDFNDNLETSDQTKTFYNGVFDSVFKKSNEYWKSKSKDMSDAEYEDWIMKYVASDESHWSKRKDESCPAPGDYASVTYRCIQCDKIYQEESQLMKHNRRNHTDKERYGCNQCDKSFNEKGRLTEHTKRHMVGKPFVCGECGKSYGQKGHLEEHQRRHSGIKPFSCSECGKFLEVNLV